jgi:hypothetical protein
MSPRRSFRRGLGYPEIPEHLGILEYLVNLENLGILEYLDGPEYLEHPVVLEFPVALEYPGYLDLLSLGAPEYPADQFRLVYLEYPVDRMHKAQQ